MQQRVIGAMVVVAQGVRRPLQIDGAPQHDGFRHQLEFAGPIALLLKVVAADFAQAVEGHDMTFHSGAAPRSLGILAAELEVAHR